MMLESRATKTAYMPASPPSFIYFDLGNVLLLFDHDIACRQMAQLADVTPNQIREIIFETDLQWRYERGEISTREFYEVFCERTGSRPDLAELQRAASDMFELNVPMIPILSHLKLAGYRIGILSNTCDAHWQFVTDGRYAFIDQYFDEFALSFEIGSMKPEPEIYEAAARKAAVAPEEIFFVDDREENVAGACQAGFDAVRYTSTTELLIQTRLRHLRFNL